MTKVKSATDTIARYGLVGWPIEHSRSPELHNGWFAKHGLAAEYEKYSVAPEEVKGWFAYPPYEFDGLNVTMPHKNMAAQLAEESSDWVQILQAANTLIRLPSGGWRAENTDAPGFAEVVRSFIGGEISSAHRIVVFGAGATASAAVAGLAMLGVSEIFVVARVGGQAERLKAQFADLVAIHLIAWEEIANLAEKIDQPLGALIHTTPLGMGGQHEGDSVQALEALLGAIPWQDLVEKNALAGIAPPVFLDAVYPASRLVATAQKAGFSASDGVPLLRAQARLSFQHWFGFLPEAIETKR